MTTNQIEEYCCGFCFIGGTPLHVVLIQKDHPEPQWGLLNGIGGRIKKNEPSVSAMTREFREETGVDTDEIGWSHFVTLSRPLVRVWFFRRFDEWRSGTCVRSERKGELVCTEEVDALLRGERQRTYLVSDLRWLIPLALDRGVAPGGIIFNDNPPISPPQEEKHHP